MEHSLIFLICDKWRSFLLQKSVIHKKLFKAYSGIDKTMKFLSTLCFISLSLIKKTDFIQTRDIHEYWVDQNRKKFGYVDTIGNVIEFESGVKNGNLLYKNIPHLNRFYKNENTTILNYYDKNHEKSHIITPSWERKFVWKDTTLSESVHDNNYYRCNSFGSLYMYNLTSHKMWFLELQGKSRRKYFQQQVWVNGISFSVNIANKLSIQELKRNKMEELFFHELSENSILRKMKIYSTGDLFYILLHYDNNSIHLLTVKKIGFIEKYQLVGTFKMKGKKTIIDSDIQYPFLITTTANELDIYEIKSNVFVEKIITKVMPNLPSYTSILFHENWILFNGQSRVLYFVYLVYS